jgi:hypothetical protein
MLTDALKVGRSYGKSQFSKGLSKATVRVPKDPASLRVGQVRGLVLGKKVKGWTLREPERKYERKYQCKKKVTFAEFSNNVLPSSRFVVRHEGAVSSRVVHVGRGERGTVAGRHLVSQPVEVGLHETVNLEAVEVCGVCNLEAAVPGLGICISERVFRPHLHTQLVVL